VNKWKCNWLGGRSDKQRLNFIRQSYLYAFTIREVNKSSDAAWPSWGLVSIAMPWLDDGLGLWALERNNCPAGLQHAIRSSCKAQLHCLGIDWNTDNYWTLVLISVLYRGSAAALCWTHLMILALYARAGVMQYSLSREPWYCLSLSKWNLREETLALGGDFVSIQSPLGSTIFRNLKLGGIDKCLGGRVQTCEKR